MSVGAVNKNTGDRIPTAGMPAVDSVLSGTSTNPVQNRVVKAALDDKQDKTDNSLQTTDKTVVGAINEHEGDISSLKSGLTNHENKNNVVIGWDNRNLWDEQGEQGIYNTETGEKSTGNNFRCKNYIPCEPETNYYMVKPNIGCYVLFYTSTKQFIRSISLNADSHVITTPENAEYITFYMFLAYGTTYNNDISFNADNTDTTYHKYRPAIGDKLMELDVALSVPNGAGKNVLPLTLANLKARNTTGTWSGNVYTCPNVAFTVNTNDDGLVTSISTTSSGSYSDTMALEFKLPKGTYILGSGFNETSGTTDTLLFKDNVVIARGNSASPGQTFTLDSESTVVWDIRVTSSDITAYPMIRPATITDPTFAPYIPSVESRIEAVENKIKTDTFSGTTDAYGNVNLNNYRYVLTAYAGGYICIPFEYNYNRYIKVLSTTTFEQVANTNVSGAYTYIDS